MRKNRNIKIPPFTNKAIRFSDPFGAQAKKASSSQHQRGMTSKVIEKRSLPHFHTRPLHFSKTRTFLEDKFKLMGGAEVQCDRLA